MAEVEITQEEVRGIDINQVASMQLKDGTVVVVNSEDDQYNNNAEFTQEEVPENNYYEDINFTIESSNLRARPYAVMPGALPRPMPHKPLVQVIPPPHPIPVHRGPARPQPGYGMHFRARPVPYGYNPKPHLPPPKGHVVLPVAKHPTVFKPVAKQPYVAPRPGGMVQRPLVNQIITGFRSRPQLQDEEFQEEDFGEDQYCECDEQYIEEESNQLRARPIGYNPLYPKPVVNVVPPPHHHPKPVAVLPPKRGPVQHIPAVYTHQPRGFRARRPAPIGFAPVTTYQPRTVLPPPPHSFKPPMHHPGRVVVNPMGVRLRSRPRSSSYEIERNQNNEEFYDECNETCVCSKCGKEF